ncbi:MAG TPA: hypothetical protein PKE26_09455 [Kiritimatiellia bacterium]|nr:hypothetical protein [Kiritimatiellia bacterium]HMO99321.1 hypothetical protein [Kiritimatiellia bacterium]
MQSRVLRLPRSTQLGMGYLAANLLALATGYTLDIAGIFTSIRMFYAWLTICLFINVTAWPDWRIIGWPWRHWPVRGPALWVVLILAMTTWIRLAAPVMNAALAGVDSYNFVNFYTWILADQKAIHYYPSGFALITAMAPVAIQPYEAARWAPHLVFLACQVAAFGFWQRLVGARAAIGLTLCIGTAWFLYPVTAIYPHFIQWTTAYVCVPAVVFVYARLVTHPSTAPLLWGISINALFAMTSAYFSIFINAVCAFIAVMMFLYRRLSALELMRTALLAMTPVLMLAFFIGVITSHFWHDWDTGIAVQSHLIAEEGRGQGHSPDPGEADPLLQIIASFLLPRQNVVPHARWLVYAGLLGMAMWIWRRYSSKRHSGVRIIAGVVLVSTLSAMTGMIELPAWEGRNVFIAIFCGLALLIWSANRLISACGLRLIKTTGGMILVMAIVAGPSLLWPPMIGRNVPIAPVTQPRFRPGDNRVLEELCRTRPDSQKKTMALLLQPGEPAALMQNLLRLKPHAWRDAFAGYTLFSTDDPRAALEADAVLAPVEWLEKQGRPAPFEVHAEGPGYVLLMRP